MDPFFTFNKFQASLGDIAVSLFFFISGFLIIASWFNCRSLNDYLRRRILRIFPGYLVALVLSFLVAMVFAIHPLADFPQHLQGFDDIFSFGFAGLNGDWIFPANPFNGCVNGSLWTIGREFTCYLLLAAAGIFGLLKRRDWVLGFFIFIFAIYGFLLANGVNVTFSNWKLSAFFVAGSCAWLWRDKILLSPVCALIALFLTLFTTQYPPFFALLAPLTIGYLVLWAAFAFHIKFFAWCDKTDLSYGVYLYAFPIQQILAYYGIKNPWLMFALATLIALGVAFLSWNRVEKPCLKLKAKNFHDHDSGGPESVEPLNIPGASKVSW